MGERTNSLARLRARLFHHGLPVVPDVTTTGQQRLARAELPAASREVLDVGRRMIKRVDAELDSIDREIAMIARRLAGCAVLHRERAVGVVLSGTMHAELGDTRRFSSPRQAVRFAGLDVTVHAPDAKRARDQTSPGKDRRSCAGRSTRRPAVPGVSARPITRIGSR
jgi:transposase